VGPGATRPTKSRLAVLALAVVTLIGAAGCGGHGKGKTSESQRLLELRPVLDSTPPPCPSAAPQKGELLVPESRDGKELACLRLDEPIIDARDVRSATMADTQSGEPAVSVVLGQIGSANLDAFAKTHQGKRLAIVVSGGLVNAPTLPEQFFSFAGRVQVTGLAKDKSTDLFNQLNKLVHPAS
jgi:preprotein translocase subunit SecD